MIADGGQVFFLIFAAPLNDFTAVKKTGGAGFPLFSRARLAKLRAALRRFFLFAVCRVMAFACLPQLG